MNCITLYTRGTVEERLLAYRPRERAFGSSGAPTPFEEAGAPADAAADDDTALSMLGAAEGGSGSSGRRNAGDACSLAKLTFLLGLNADDMMVNGPL